MSSSAVFAFFMTRSWYWGTYTDTLESAPQMQSDSPDISDDIGPRDNTESAKTRPFNFQLLQAAFGNGNAEGLKKSVQESTNSTDEYLENLLNETGGARKWYYQITRPHRQFLHVDDYPSINLMADHSAVSREMEQIIQHWTSQRRTELWKNSNLSIHKIRRNRSKIQRSPQVHVSHTQESKPLSSPPIPEQKSPIEVLPAAPLVGHVVPKVEEETSASTIGRVTTPEVTSVLESTALPEPESIVAPISSTVPTSPIPALAKSKFPSENTPKRVQFGPFQVQDDTKIIQITNKLPDLSFFD